MSDFFRNMSRETRVVVGLVSGSEFVNHMYSVLIPPIIVILASDFQVSVGLIGLALGVQAAMTAVFQLPFGYISDHYNRLYSLSLCLGIGSIGVFVTALAPDYYYLVLGQAIIGIGTAGHHPTHFPLLSSATTKAVRGRVFSIRGFAGNIGFAVPPVLIAAVISQAGYSWRHGVALIGAAGLTYAVIAVLGLHTFVSREVLTPVKSPNGSLRDQFRMPELDLEPVILGLAVVAFISSFLGWGLTSYTVVHLTEVYRVNFGLANTALTGMFVAAAFMMLVGGYLTDKLTAATILKSSFVGLLLLIALFSSAAIPALLALVVVLLIGGMRSIGSPARSKLTDLVSRRDGLGKSFAIITIGMTTGKMVAPPLFGFITDIYGVQTAFHALTFSALIGVALTFHVVNNIERDMK